MIDKIKRFFNLLSEFDSLTVSVDKRISLLEHNRTVLQNEFSSDIQDLQTDVKAINRAQELTDRGVKEIRSTLFPEGEKKIFIKKYVDKVSDELVHQEIHETRTPR